VRDAELTPGAPQDLEPPRTQGREIGRFLRHSAVYAAGNILDRIGAFLLLPVYTRHLSVAEYGALEMMYVVSAVVMGILSVGIAHATLRFYFEYDDERERNAVVSTNLYASTGIALAGVALVAPWVSELAEVVFRDAAYARGIAIVLATLVLELSSQVCLAYLRAKEYSLFFVGLSLAKLVVQVAINTYLIVYRHTGVEGALIGNLAAVAMGWLVLAVFTTARCGMRFDYTKIAQILAYSFPFLLSTLVGIVSANVDRVLLNELLSLEAIGIYALALKFAQLLQALISEPFSRAYGAFRFSIMNDPQAGAIQARIVRYLAIVAGLVALAIALFTREVLVLMSDPAFLPAVEVLPILLVAQMFAIFSYPAQTGILVRKETRYVFYVGLATAALSVAANLGLIRGFGVMGAGVAKAIVAACALALNLAISQRLHAVGYEYARIGIVLVSCAVLFGVAVPLNSQPLSAALLGKATLYLLFCGVLFFSPALDRAERAWILGGATSLLRRRSRKPAGAARKDER
jgi:O-antigen/teichoic acid export membrane protein